MEGVLGDWHSYSDYAIFDRSALLKLSAARLTGRQLDALCDRFNVAAV